MQLKQCLLWKRKNVNADIEDEKDENQWWRHLPEEVIKRSRKPKWGEGNKKPNSKNQLTRKWKTNTENKWHWRWFFKKINKINKPLARLMRGKKNPTNYLYLDWRWYRCYLLLVNIIKTISCIICANKFELRWNGHISFTLNISSKKGNNKAENTLKANTAKRPHLLDLVDRYVGVGHVPLMLEKLNWNSKLTEGKLFLGIIQSTNMCWSLTVWGHCSGSWEHGSQSETRLCPTRCHWQGEMNKEPDKVHADSWVPWGKRTCDDVQAKGRGWREAVTCESQEVNSAREPCKRGSPKARTS